MANTAVKGRNWSPPALPQTQTLTHEAKHLEDVINFQGHSIYKECHMEGKLKPNG